MWPTNDLLIAWYFTPFSALFQLTLSQTTNFRLLQTKEFAEDNFEFDKNCGKFSERVENAVRKGEIACYETRVLKAL